MPLLSSPIIVTLLLHECLLVLILNDLASYKIALQNCVLTTATDFIKEILVPTLQNYRTNNQRSTRYDELQAPDNIDQMELYSGTTRATLQPVLIPPGVTDFYTLIDTSFSKPKSKAVQINVMWRFDGTDYGAINAEYKAWQEEEEKMAEARRKAKEEEERRMELEREGKRVEFEAEEEKKKARVAAFRAMRAKRLEEERRGKDKSVSKATTATDEAIPGDRDDATPDVDSPRDGDETQSDEEVRFGESIVVVRIYPLLPSTSLLDSLAYWFIYTGL
jgi:hypothetical protein